MPKPNPKDKTQSPEVAALREAILAMSVGSAITVRDPEYIGSLVHKVLASARRLGERSNPRRQFVAFTLSDHAVQLTRIK